MSDYLPQEIIDDLRTQTMNLVTEDNEPVDNWFSEKQQRLLVEPLLNSWQPVNIETLEPRVFVAAANVGVFGSPRQPPTVPDAFISLDVSLPDDLDFSYLRSYFVWEFDKAPDVVVEIVSNKKGGESEIKMRRYAKLGVAYYVVFDPFKQLSGEALKVHELIFGGRRYGLRQDFRLPEVGLSAELWRGVYEGCEDEWLRWYDVNGKLIPTGHERAQQEAVRAKQEFERAESEAKRANGELQRAENEAQRADSESQRAESEAKRAENEFQRAQNAEAEVALLRRQLEKLQGKS